MYWTCFAILDLFCQESVLVEKCPGASFGRFFIIGRVTVRICPLFMHVCMCACMAVALAIKTIATELWLWLCSI